MNTLYVNIFQIIPLWATWYNAVIRYTQDIWVLNKANNQKYPNATKRGVESLIFQDMNLTHKTMYVFLGGLLLGGLVTHTAINYELEGTQDGSTAYRELKMSYIPAACDLVNFIALEKGFYAEEGLGVELTKFESSNQTAEALIAGRIDVTGCFSSPVAFSIEANQPHTLKIIRSIASSPEESFLWLVVASDNEEIRSFEDLPGKRVGRFPGSTSEAQLEYILKQVGVDPSTVRSQPIAQSQQLNALISGNVDALLALEPTASVAEIQEIGRKLESAERYFPTPRYNSQYAVLRTFYNENPGLVDKVIQAQDKALEYIRENPRESRKVLTKYTPYSEEIVTNVTHGIPLMNDEIDTDKAQEYADVLISEDVLEHRINVSNLY